MRACERPDYRVEIIDTHCHLDVEAFDADRSAVIDAARAAGVTAIVVPAIHRAAWPRLLALCRAGTGLHPALGLHPVYLAQHRDTDLHELEACMQTQPPLAIGEIGLDFVVPDLDRDRQQRLFEAQLVIARETRLPVLLHVRKAHDQVLATLARLGVHGGIAHAYNGTLEQARRYLDLGFRLGFGGMLTYARSRRLRALARELPAEAIVLETDAPDLTPAEHHGERNSPAYLPAVLAALAEIRGQTQAELAVRTSANARAVLALPITPP